MGSRNPRNEEVLLSHLRPHCAWLSSPSTKGTSPHWKQGAEPFSHSSLNNTGSLVMLSRAEVGGTCLDEETRLKIQHLDFSQHRAQQITQQWRLQSTGFFCAHKAPSRYVSIPLWNDNRQPSVTLHDAVTEMTAANTVRAEQPGNGGPLQGEEPPAPNTILGDSEIKNMKTSYLLEGIRLLLRENIQKIKKNPQKLKICQKWKTKKIS